MLFNEGLWLRHLGTPHIVRLKFTFSLLHNLSHHHHHQRLRFFFSYSSLLNTFFYRFEKIKLTNNCFLSLHLSKTFYYSDLNVDDRSSVKDLKPQQSKYEADGGSGRGIICLFACPIYSSDLKVDKRQP